jgi:hypothetical protein
METKTERAQGYRKEAEKYAKLARSGQVDITSVHRTLRSGMRGWRQTWREEKISLACHVHNGKERAATESRRPHLE